YEEKWPKDQFIFDIQTHHVDVSHKWYDDTPDGKKVKTFFMALRSEGKSLEDKLDLLNRTHYVKEVFFDSDTVMAVISGVPTRNWDKNPLPPDQMVATRAFVNDLAGSQRVLSHGILRPNMGRKELDEIERQIKELKIDAGPQQIPWISDIFAILKRNPAIKNIYFELGSTFGQLSAFAPETCMHMLGQMIQTAGADHILWGTDSIWGGSPQSQIERLR